MQDFRVYYLPGREEDLKSIIKEDEEDHFIVEVELKQSSVTPINYRENSIILNI